MTILFVGSSPTDLGGATVSNTTTNARDPNFTPIGSEIYFDADNTGQGFTISHEMPSTKTAWYHFLFNTTQKTQYGTNQDGYWFRIFSGTVEIARVDCFNNTWTLKGGSATSPVFTPFGSNVDITYDVKVTCTGTNVTVEIYQNTVLTVSISYASTVDAPVSIVFDHYDMVWATNANYYRYSEFIITDGVPTLGWRLATLQPNIAGTYNQWDGIPENLRDAQDGQSISTVAANQKESWTLSNYLGPVTASGVYALVNKTIANVGNAGPTQIAPFIRHAGVDVENTPFIPTPGGDLEILYNNPQTGLTWNTADLATLEIGVKSIA